MRWPQRKAGIARMTTEENQPFHYAEQYPFDYGDKYPYAFFDMIQELREAGCGYKHIYKELKMSGYDVTRSWVQRHVADIPRNIESSIADAVDDATEEVNEGYFAARGIEEPPENMAWVAATVEERGPNGEKHWVRVKPLVEEAAAERVEIRQARPVKVTGSPPRLPRSHTQSSWQTWIVSPDAQIGYWVDSHNEWHTIHDERCFSLGHQIAAKVRSEEGIHGWLDVGDFADLAAFSRHNPTAIDLRVDGLNRTWQRGAEEFARRRWVVGEEGELVLLDANHTIRMRSKASSEMPYLVGMRRADDPVDEHPVLSVPYLTRARDYGVEWVPAWPSGYRRLNSNLAAFHAPAYGSKAMDTARKIAAKVHMSVVHGHTHRREALAENIETSNGARTMEVWSDGTWARTDGSLPSARNTYDDHGDRMTATNNASSKVGYLSESMHQGMSVVHVELGGKERFSVERVAFWDGWAQFRGQSFNADCDVDGYWPGENGRPGEVSGG